MNYIRIDATNLDGFTSVLPASYFDGAGICLGAYEEDGSVCGAIALSYDGVQYDIDWLYVVGEKRLAGVGTGLIREVKHIVAELGVAPIRAQFDIEEDTGLYAFFLSMDDPDFTVDVAYSHNRYFSNTEDFIESFGGGDFLKLPRPRLFWSLKEELKDQALSLAMEHLEITDAAKDYIISHSYDPAFGARPLKRYLQSHVETLIARTILAGELVAGETVVVNVKDGELNVEEK